MIFRRPFLASVIAIASTTAFGMEVLDEEGLSATAAQAGLDIFITPPAGGFAFSLIYHDLDGIPVGTFPGSPYTSAGALIIGDTPGTTGKTRFSISNTGGFLFKLDAGASGTTGGLINVNLTSTATTVIHTGDLRVGVSNAGVGLRPGGALTEVVMQDVTINIGAGNLMNMQLGNEGQGNMMKLNASYTGGLSIANLNMIDAAGSAIAGGIKISNISIKDCGSASCATVGANLATDLGVDFNTSGMQLGFNSLGNATNGGAHVMLADIRLGSFSGSLPSMGDLELNGFNPSGTTLQISAH